MRRIHERDLNTPEYYEQIWAVENNLRPFYDTVRQKALAEKIKKNDYVIDVGCGVFGTCQFVAEHAGEYPSGLRLFCVDHSEKAKQIVTGKHPEIIFTKMDCKKLDGLKTGQYDVVISGEVIEHMEDTSMFASELCRICKPGGWIVISTVDTNCPDAIAHGDYPEHLWEFTPDDLIGMFSGFGETEYRVVGDYHFIYCRKHGA